MSKRKAAEPNVVKNITINNNYTINNYFAKQEGPAPAPEAPTGPVNLFPNGERSNYEETEATKSRPSRRVLVSRASPDGTLWAGCFCCKKNSFLSMERFAPMECNKNGRKRPDFYKALGDYETAYSARDLDASREARGRVEALRLTLCPPCAENGRKLSPAQEACKDEWERMRKEACAQNDGCRHPSCVERGDQASCVLEADHVHTKAEEDEELRKTHALSDYAWWAGNGSVAAMRHEAAKGLQWPCCFCHRLEKTGKAANKYPDPATMPDGKYNGTEEERKQYNRKRKAIIVYPKQQYVDAIKRGMCCELCSRQVLVGQEHAFIFDHRDASTKMKGKGTLAGEKGGVAGLVRNCANEASLEEIKDVLNAEAEKCRLLCANCDHRQTWDYPMRV
jgi:hypothetical protein